MTREEVAQILEDFVEGKGGRWDWDDFISIPLSGDAELREIQVRSGYLGKEFPPERRDQYCNEKGIEVLRAYIKKLRQSD